MARKLLAPTLTMRRKPTDNLSEYEAGVINRDLQRSSEAAKCPKDLLAAERLEAAGRLAAWLAHQINNPLGAILGSAQLLARRLQRDIDNSDALQGYLRYLEEIQSQTERCAGITAEMLNFTRPGEPDLRRVDIREVISEAVALVRYAYPESQIVLGSNSDDVIPPVRADKTWLTRVVFELASNAVEASAESPVSISAEVIPRRGNRASEVRIKVADSGTGIDKRVRPRIFDPFFSTREKARGLGLTLSLDMVRRMGGSLQVARSDHRGSVFEVGMPIWGREG